MQASDTMVQRVADYFLSFCHEHGDNLTNLKLQKLIYYAQAWHLAIFSTALFDEGIEAWIHGPVIPSVYHRFKRYQWNSISEEIIIPELGDEIRELLDEVLEVYGGFQAFQLEEITHREDPWIVARNGLSPDEISHNRIDINLMRSYYFKRLDG